MRYLYESLAQFAKDKFVLISGPRQAGKTTLAKHWLGERGLYLDWDDDEQRRTLIKRSFLNPLDSHAFVFDELHKYGRWKSWLKGLYDNYHDQMEVVVTGSARLDLFQKGGDSLLGRCEHLRLHPFSIGELTHGRITPPPNDWLQVEHQDASHSKWLQLEQMSGFPEPFLKNDPLHHRRWASRRRSLIIQEDVRGISQIKDVSLVEHLAVLLPDRVGSPLSLNALREELSVAHDTIASWLEVLERLYFCFRISPYHRKINRGLKKEQKLYLWDWSEIENPAARFENMVAGHLLKAVHAWNDMGYGEYDLHYVRDKEKNEIDFLITEKRKPAVLFECKLSDANFSCSTRLMDQLGNIPAIQLTASDGINRTKGRIRVVTASRYLAGLI